MAVASNRVSSAVDKGRQRSVCASSVGSTKVGSTSSGAGWLSGMVSGSMGGRGGKASSTGEGCAVGRV